MMKYVAFFGLVAVASAGLLQEEYGQDGHEDHQGPAHYDFSYNVQDPHTGDVKEQSEQRDGHNVAGHYSLVEPDGHRRVVHYTADEHNGFNAQVTREGETHHIQHDNHGNGHGDSGYLHGGNNGHLNGGHATSHSSVQHNNHQAHH